MQLKLIENLFGGFKVVAQMMGQLGIGRGTLKRLSSESFVRGDGWFPGVDFYFTISVGVF